MSGKLNGRRVLAAVVSAALMLGGAPVPLWSAVAWPAPGAPHGHYVQSGGKTYHLEFTEDRVAGAGFIAGRGWIEATVRRADEAGGGWANVITWRLDRFDGKVTSSYSVGPDHVEVQFAESAATSVEGPGPMVVTINGVRGDMDGDWIDAVLSRADPDAVPVLPESLTGATRALVDPEGFVDAWTTLAEVGRKLLPTAESLDQAIQASPQCLGACASCARSIMLMGLSWIAVASGCGAAAGTGGMAFVICVAAVLGHGTIVAVATVGCAICLDCLDPDPPEPPGDGGSDPEPVCPLGTIPCCVDQCCEAGAAGDVGCD